MYTITLLYITGGSAPCHAHRLPLKLTWGAKTVQVVIYWFQYESDPERNSNVYEVAQKCVADHFPGEFGSERLVQQVGGVAGGVGSNVHVC